ncbi:hypothetical protein [Psychrobacillus sp. L4]|uniref:hypothetical protein n=1 Tax=Psychrobacillus sp. L4 TaxID=3236892 RepID=UPI0036F29ABF
MGAEFKGIEFIAYPDTHVQEIEKIIADNKTHVDQWYFSGQFPYYYYAYQNGWIRSDEAAYAQLHGSGFLGALLEGIFSKGEIIQRASMDTLCNRGYKT